MDPNDYWYAWKPAAFRKATRHLTALQRGIYRDLIDEYMETREPLPASDVALANIARISVEEWTHVKKEILEFYTESGGKLFHVFCNETLDEQDDKARVRSKASKKAASKRWEHKRKPKMPDASQAQCEPDANGMPQNAIGEERIGKEEETPLVPLGISQQLWQEYKTHRTQKRDTLTDIAETRALRKLERLKAEGHDPSRVIEQSLENGWTGLFEIKTEGKNHEKTNRSHYGSNGKSRRAREVLDAAFTESLERDGQENPERLALPEL